MQYASSKECSYLSRVRADSSVSNLSSICQLESEDKLLQTDKIDSAKKQASLFSFFQKSLKSDVGSNGDMLKSESNKETPMKMEADTSIPVDHGKEEDEHEKTEVNGNKRKAPNLVHGLEINLKDSASDFEEEEAGKPKVKKMKTATNKERKGCQD